MWTSSNHRRSITRSLEAVAKGQITLLTVILAKAGTKSVKVLNHEEHEGH